MLADPPFWSKSFILPFPLPAKTQPSFLLPPPETEPGQPLFPFNSQEKRRDPSPPPFPQKIQNTSEPWTSPSSTPCLSFPPERTPPPSPPVERVVDLLLPFFFTSPETIICLLPPFFPRSPPDQGFPFPYRNLLFFFSATNKDLD